MLMTLGEPAGIGSDCVLLAHQAQPELFSDIRIVAPASWLKLRAKELGIDTPIHALNSLNTTCDDKSALYCWSPLQEKTVPPISGKPSIATADAVIACIEAAALACMHGQASAHITGPIEKAVLRDAGFNFPGHTEFLAHLAREHLGRDCDIVMMLASKVLRVALLTTHMAISDVSSSLSIEKSLRCIEITHADLQQRFGINKPRIGLCGLNPHAGEQGHFGREEIDILMPAVLQARKLGIDISNPLPADTLFSAQMRDQFDVIICCYHDQALIPIKTLSFGDAVNVTLGLPFIRTSVDHGTALDRAGSGKVSYSSLVEAIELARFMKRKSEVTTTVCKEVRHGDK
ncbi:MAG: 4-hydroxythreonine-4-phosphate dehydrogenase PdxA [Mariprofundaceae bacterium]|nr:4-hydroxythreonine-4-phosphate dehydrogenase PdxA [Mariprofundaceae bacterium]